MHQTEQRAKRGADGKWIAGLRASTPIVDAARRVLTIRLEVVRDYLGLALREPDKDVEYVHQLRVGTRRAGAAVEIFSCCLPEKVYKSARKQLKRLRRAAGEARDWDVFLMTLTQAPHKKTSRQQAGLDFLAGYALAQRSIAQGHLEEASPDDPFAFDRFLADTIAAVEKPSNGVQTLSNLASPMLSTLLSDLQEAAGADLSAYSSLHRVRILGKRLRYAMEVFAACYPPPFRQKLYPTVEEMQDILGRANDSYVASQRLEALCAKIQATRSGDWKRLQPGIQGLLQYHQQRLPEERQRFLGWWRRWQRSGCAAAFGAMLRGAKAAAS
ncbi:MAG TPA: CHAD domain-containing protein [Gemmataceae bacterium]|nr:CHAD domain-containing protein [Gemmataceae bacterium]